MNTTKDAYGPVAVTGADGHVGRALQDRLRAQAAAVRKLQREGDWRPELSDVAAVVHLAGTLQPRRPNSYEKANVATTERLVSAVVGSHVGRVVFLSYVGADPGSENAYLRTKGRAEELIRASGIPSVIFRSTFIYGNHNNIGPSFSSYRTSPGGSVSLVGDGTQRLAPINVDDISGLLAAAALDPETPTGVFEVGGPDVLTLDEMVRLINADGVRIRHLSPQLAKLISPFTPQLTRALVEILATDSIPSSDPTETAGRFGVSLRSIRDLMAMSEGLR